MSSWSQRRKFSYAFIVIIVLVGFVGLPIFLHYYKAPTCSDGKQNGNETGVDCGGSCTRLCQNSFLAPSVSWSRFEPVAPGLYNVASYIVNPNAEGEARNVPYKITLYDDQGVFIRETTGVVDIPPHRNTIAFSPAVDVGKRTPARALFELTKAPVWYKSIDRLSPLVIKDKKYSEDDIGSSLLVEIQNTSTFPINDLDVYTVLYDKAGNAIGFSKTAVDTVPGSGSARAPFTWPVKRNGAVISIEVLPVAK